MQRLEKIQPLYMNLVTSPLKHKAMEAVFLKNYQYDFKPDAGGKQASNLGKGKKLQSNWQLIKLDLPTGKNKVMLSGENRNLNEAYVGVWNSFGEHTIYVLYGDTMTSDIVYRGANLGFILDPRAAVPAHRMHVRMIYDIKEGNDQHIREKILVFTDGNGWQRWINVLSSIATKSYNATLFPYYKLRTPHFDKDELIDYPVHPPMYAPVITPLPRTADDKGKQSLLLNKSTQLAYRDILTDGRASTFSPWSNPYFISKANCSSSKTLTRAISLKLYAGSPHVERKQIFVKIDNGDWMLYDTIDKFDSSGDNAPEKIGDAYWLRTNPWAKYNYDPETNTIDYTYLGDLQATVFDVKDALAFQNDVPIRSIAMTAAGDALLWKNNLYGYDNLPTETLEKFDFNVVNPTPTDQCAVRNAKIVVYAIIERQGIFNGDLIAMGQVVYQKDGVGKYFFGGLKNIFEEAPAGVGDRTKLYEQIKFDEAETDLLNLSFGDNANLICYLAGTPYTAVGEQYRVDASGNLTKIGALNSRDNADLAVITNTYKSGGYFVQRFEFNVPAGRYVARLARHDVAIGTDVSATSTYVVGKFKHNNVFEGTRFKVDPVIDINKEFEIDTTTGDVDVWNGGETDLFYVMVPRKPQFEDDWRFIEGYVIEDSDTKLPWEQLSYFVTKGKYQNAGRRTDHNGFFFGFSVEDKSAEISFSGYYGCSSKYLFSTAVGNAGGGFYPGRIITASETLGTINQNGRITLKGKVVDCKTGLSVPSVGVTLTNSKTFYTDSDGNFELLVHEVPEGDRIARIFFNTGGDCLFRACDCGTLALVPFTSAGLPCIQNQPRELPALTVQVRLIVQAGKGLWPGGKFGFSVVAHDGAGRSQFIQEVKYLDIPTFLETKIIAPSTIDWSLNGSLNLPSWVKWLTFFRTSDRNAQTRLQWVGDKIDYLDNKGNTVVNGNGAIRAKITIQSLIDFNIKNNFNTNVNYQFTPGDIIRVLDDGDNNLMDLQQTDGFMDYQVLGTNYNQTVDGYTGNNVFTATETIITDKDGNVSTQKSTTAPNPNASEDGVSLIVEYDERLLKLKDKTGFWIEIIRPKDIAAIDRYMEIVGTIPVIAGEPTITSGTLDTFDSYFQTRFIRIPNALGKSLGHPFLSPSVSDYWGKDISSGGRSLVKDAQARQTWSRNDVMKTDQIVNEGRVNGLGRCRSENRKNFDGQTFGGIVAGHAERNRIVIICENDWFMCDYNLNYVKVTPQGLIQASLDQNLSDPYPKEGFNFGCAYEDTASIIFYDGHTLWADRYNSAILELQNGKISNVVDEFMKPYFINKFKQLKQFNQALGSDDYLFNLVDIVAGINPQNGDYNLTFRPRRGLDPNPQHFVNNEREIFYDTQETVVYNSGIWKLFAGYTPEFYCTMPGARSGVEMLTFAAGQPWFHNSLDQKGSNTFYGIKTDTVIECALNINETDSKLFQALAIETAEGAFFVDRVQTDDPKLFSYIPPAYFSRVDKTLFSHFLPNMSSYPNTNKPVTSMVADGGRIYGKLALVRVVSNPNKIDDYSELNTIGYRIAEKSPVDK